jgi:hypothetical protein
MASTDEGMQIDRSDEQSWKANSPRCQIRHSGLNVTVDRFAHCAKQHLEIVSTDEGTEIA